MNAVMEEKYGLLNHAVEVYDRMVDVVPYEQKMDALNIYIVKVAEYLGVTKTRHIFEVFNLYSILYFYQQILERNKTTKR